MQIIQENSKQSVWDKFGHIESSNTNTPSTPEKIDASSGFLHKEVFEVQVSRLSDKISSLEKDVREIRQWLVGGIIIGVILVAVIGVVIKIISL